MLDIKRIRENLDDIKKAMDRRGEKEFDLDAVVALDDERRELLKEVEVMKNEMNIESKKIPQLIKEGKDVTADKARLKELSDKIKAVDEKVKSDKFFKAPLSGGYGGVLWPHGIRNCAGTVSDSGTSGRTFKLRCPISGTFCREEQ